MADSWIVFTSTLPDRFDTETLAAAQTGAKALSEATSRPANAVIYHNATHVYYSPAAAEMLDEMVRDYGGKPCERPAPGLAFLHEAGGDEDWAREHFWGQDA